MRDTYRLDRWHLDRLPALLKDPLAVLRAEYGNAMQTAADANAMADKLFPRLVRLLRALGVTCRYGFDPDDAALLGDAVPLMAPCADRVRRRSAVRRGGGIGRGALAVGGGAGRSGPGHQPLRRDRRAGQRRPVDDSQPISPPASMWSRGAGMA